MDEQPQAGGLRLLAMRERMILAEAGVPARAPVWGVDRSGRQVLAGFSSSGQEALEGSLPVDSRCRIERQPQAIG